MSSGSKKTTQTTTQTLDPTAQNAIYGANGIFNSAATAYKNAPTSYYSGDTYAGLNDTQKAALQGSLNYLGSPDATQGADALKTAGSFAMQPTNIDMSAYDLGPTSKIDLSPFLKSADPIVAQQVSARTEDTNNPFLKQTVDSATSRLTDNFNTSVLPQIRGGAQEAGQYGSSRQGIAEGLAAKGLSQSVGDMTGNMYSTSYEGAQNRNNASANAAMAANSASNNMAMQLNNQNERDRLNNLMTGMTYNAGADNSTKLASANLGFTRANTASGLATDNVNRMLSGADAINAGSSVPYSNYGKMFDIGSTYQGDTQGQNNADYAKWLYETQAPWQNLSNYSSVINPYAQLQSTTKGVQKTPGNSALQNIAGVANIAASFMG